ETIACTLNGASIYFVARYTPEKAAPGIADKIGHFLLPRGPAGRFHTVGPFSNCITSYSENKDVAKDYIRYCHQKEVYEKFLRSETIACTLNGASIYFVARYTPEKAAPGIADKIGHFLLPRGPAGRFHTVGPFSNCITSYSENKDVAKDYIRYCHQKEVYEKFL